VSPLGLAAPANNTFNQIAVVNGAGACMYLAGVSTRVSQVAAVGCAIGVEIASGDQFFSGNLLIGDSSSRACSVAGGTGLDEGCLSATSTYRPKTGMASAFVGKVADNHHLSAVGGVALFADILEWTAFENAFRGWGVTGDAFPALSNQGACAAGMECQIWDWRLKASDLASLRNLSGDGLAPDEVFVANQPCPNAVQGDVVVTDQQTTPQTFLMNALELVEDGVGDEDGLCESNERCAYSPNFGAYQGEGDVYASGHCTFQDGAPGTGVVGVVMVAYPVNGAP
jgi:hypothetical protein